MHFEITFMHCVGAGVTTIALPKSLVCLCGLVFHHRSNDFDGPLTTRKYIAAR